MKIDGKDAARMGDAAMCPSPPPLPNPIMKGAMPVLIMNMPAARESDMGTHQPAGSIMPPCSPGVEIGLAGTTGDPRAAKKQCEALANTRASGTQNQSYNNCGIEASRQLVNQVNQSNGAPPVSEDALMQTAKNTGNANGVPGGPNLFSEGGTSIAQNAALLTRSGVPTTYVAGTGIGARLGQAELALAQGRGAVVGGDVSGMPASKGYTGVSGGHAVAVTGFDYDDDGNITGVHYNDTNSMCGEHMTAQEFQHFIDVQAVQYIVNGEQPPGFALTNNPVW